MSVPTRRGRPTAPPFFGSANEHPFTGEHQASNSAPHLGKAEPYVARSRRPRKGISSGIIGGERVLIVDKPVEGEKGVEVRVRVALAAAGVMVLKHSVEPCWECGARPSKRQGLGVGCSDLICIVPPHGRFLGIEMKHPTGGVVSEEQKRFLAVVRRFGGITGVARSVEEAMQLVAEAQRGS